MPIFRVTVCRGVILPPCLFREAGIHIILHVGAFHHIYDTIVFSHAPSLFDIWCDMARAITDATPATFLLVQTYEGADGTSDMVSIPESPSAAALPPSMGWEEEKLTPRSAMGAEAGGAGIAHMRHSLGGSFNSMPSDGDSVDAQPGSVGEQLFYVHQLRARMSKEQVEMRSLIRYDKPSWPSWHLRCCGI